VAGWLVRKLIIAGNIVEDIRHNRSIGRFGVRNAP
jgi:hypothetical protein